MTLADRVLEARAGDAGPTLIVVAALHGNEPAGVAAARAVLARLDADETPLSGEIVALVGNRRALAAGARYLSRDLNRMWTDANVSAARASAVDAEARELVELADALDVVLARRRGPVFAIDLHTTSAAGVPFAVVGPSEAHRAFAANFPLPGIAGLEERLHGTLTSYLGERGCVTLAIEGGQSDSPEAVANLEATLTLALAAAGLVAPARLAGLDAARARLTGAAGDLPRRIAVVSRHEVRPERRFVMEPGFRNIDRAAAGALLAREGDEEIRAPFDGVVLLPLYQSHGADGFFFGRALD